MKIDSKDFPVPLRKKVELSEWPTKKQYRELLEKNVEELSSLQQLYYASHRYALLLIFQGMDSAGKDGAIRHVMPGVNPRARSGRRERGGRSGQHRSCPGVRGQVAHVWP
jgi:polyphosphate kinase 2 (PPK2 family)